MPNRLNEFRAPITTLVSARTPSLIHKACFVVGAQSNWEYVRRAICRALAEDLGLDYEALLEEQPRPRRDVKTFASMAKPRVSGRQTYEEVQ